MRAVAANHRGEWLGVHGGGKKVSRGRSGSRSSSRSSVNGCGERDFRTHVCACVRACACVCVRVHGRMTPKNEKGRRTIILDSSSTKSPNSYQHLEHAAAAAAAAEAQLHLTFSPLSASTQIPQCLAPLEPKFSA